MQLSLEFGMLERKKLATPVIEFKIVLKNYFTVDKVQLKLTKEWTIFSVSVEVVKYFGNNCNGLGLLRLSVILIESIHAQFHNQ